MRPFTRKNKTVEEIPPAPTDEFAQFYSNDPQYAAPVESVITTPAVSEPGPTITTDGDSAPGWYPDSQDEGLLRYWDGYHLTGQTLRIDAPEPERDESTSGSTATSDAASAAPTAQDDSVVNQVSEQPPAPPATAEAPAGTILPAADTGNTGRTGPGRPTGPARLCSATTPDGYIPLHPFDREPGVRDARRGRRRRCPARHGTDQRTGQFVHRAGVVGDHRTALAHDPSRSRRG